MCMVRLDCVKLRCAAEGVSAGKAVGCPAVMGPLRDATLCLAMHGVLQWGVALRLL